jgi:hypothetical protein
MVNKLSKVGQRTSERATNGQEKRQITFKDFSRNEKAHEGKIENSTIEHMKQGRREIGQDNSNKGRLSNWNEQQE